MGQPALRDQGGHLGDDPIIRADKLNGPDRPPRPGYPNAGCRSRFERMRSSGYSVDSGNRPATPRLASPGRPCVTRAQSGHGWHEARPLLLDLGAERRTDTRAGRAPCTGDRRRGRDALADRRDGLPLEMGRALAGAGRHVPTCDREGRAFRPLRRRCAAVRERGGMGDGISGGWVTPCEPSRTCHTQVRAAFQRPSSSSPP